LQRIGRQPRRQRGLRCPHLQFRGGSMRHHSALAVAAVSVLGISALGIVACGDPPVAPSADLAPRVPSLSASATTAPPYFFTATLRGLTDPTRLSGLIRFRQPEDPAPIVFLDTWVSNLAPNTSYRLQRATDATIDRQCTGTN